MAMKTKTADFEEAVVTRPLQFVADSDLARDLKLFDESARSVLLASTPTVAPSKKDPNR